ncbi:hypothetical protein [Methylocystis hirsuta]|nr:hypothetical protein [Methylocystis hirsuta]
MNDVVVPESQPFADPFEREGELLFGVTGDRVSPAVRRIVWHGVLSLKGKELRHSQFVPKNTKKQSFSKGVKRRPTNTS